MGCTIAGAVFGFLLSGLGFFIFAHDNEAIGIGFMIVLASAATAFVGLGTGLILANDILFGESKGAE